MRVEAVRKVIRAALLLAGLTVCASVAAQTGHPAKGSWLGHWGPEGEQHRLFLLLDWEDRTLTGTINPGPRAVTIESTTIDYATWTLTLEAEMPAATGEKRHWLAVGKLENLGSWKNRRYSGEYHFGAETGRFEVTLQ